MRLAYKRDPDAFEDADEAIFEQRLEVLLRKLSAVSEQKLARSLVRERERVEKLEKAVDWKMKVARKRLANNMPIMPFQLSIGCGLVNNHFATTCSPVGPPTADLPGFGPASRSWWPTVI